jgi:putative ABC transport system substrate-binding protein
MTGFAGVGDIAPKRIELFKEVDPRLRRVLVFIDSKDPATVGPLAGVRETAKNLKLRLIERDVATQGDIERVFGSLKRADIDGAFVVSTSLNTKFPSLFIRLASEKGVPVAGFRKEWVEQGALFSYGHDLAAVGAPAATYVDKILKGAKPADLPVEQPTKFELIINLKAAKQIGLTIPPNVLVRADKVIK